MPLYEFISRDGQYHAEQFSVVDAPSIGQTIVRDGVEFVRVVSRVSLPVMFDSKNMDAGEIGMALDHKRDIEANPGRYEWKEKGPQEFRPEIPKTVY